MRTGETISSHAYETRVGGKGANQAIAIVRAGGTVQFYGIIGRDGIWIRDSMMKCGIDVGGIIVSDVSGPSFVAFYSDDYYQEPTGRAIIQVNDETGENSIGKPCIYPPRYRSTPIMVVSFLLLVLFPGANHTKLHEAQFVKNSEGWFPETTHLLLQNEIHLESTHYALLNAKNATVILNPSPLPSASEIREFPWHKVDWLVVNETEAEGLYLSMMGTEGSPSPSAPTREVLILLSAQPLFKETNIVCTLGADGVLAFIPRFHRPSTHEAPPSFIYLPAAKLRGEIRDSTGAGDCFTGYFVQGLMEFGPRAVVGKDIKELDFTRLLKRCVYVSDRALGV